MFKVTASVNALLGVTIFTSRDLFCGKFDIEYFGKFHRTTK